MNWMNWMNWMMDELDELERSGPGSDELEQPINDNVIIGIDISAFKKRVLHKIKIIFASTSNGRLFLYLFNESFFSIGNRIV